MALMDSQTPPVRLKPLARRVRLSEALLGAVLLSGLALAGGSAWQWREAGHWNDRLADREALQAEAQVLAAALAASAADTAASAESPAAPPASPTDGGAGEAASATDPASTPRTGAAASAAGAPSWLADGRPAEWRFAMAQALGEAGALDAALARYRSLNEHPRLGLAARYNAANLLLREGRRLREAGDNAPALVLLELSKEGYRQVLRLDPEHWDARYNLERAQRLLPDPTPEEIIEAATPEQAERAATTMRGVSKGLP